MEAPKVVLVHTYAPRSEQDLFVQVQARAAKRLKDVGLVTDFFVAGGKIAPNLPTLDERYASEIRAEIPNLEDGRITLNNNAYSTGGELRPYWRHLEQIGSNQPFDLAFEAHRYVKTVVERNAPGPIRRRTEYLIAELVLTEPGTSREDNQLVAEHRASAEYQILQKYLAARTWQYALPFGDVILDGIAGFLGPRKFTLFEGRARSR